MKNFTLIAVLLAFAVTGLQAQSNIYSQDFSPAGLPSGWTNVDKTGNNPTNGIWKRQTSAQFASTTHANGYWMFLSDAQTNDNLPEDAELTSGAINCTGHSIVYLKMEHWFYTYFNNNTNSAAKVLVSNDNTTWTEVYSTTETTDNPESLALDITAYAANQATVYIRFKFTGSWDGWWAVDDINVIEPATLDATVTTVTLPAYIGPSSQVVEATVANMGSTSVTQMQLSYKIDGGAPVVQQFSGFNIQPFQEQTFTFTTPATLTTVQQHNIDVTVATPNGGTDLNASNNTATGKTVVLSHIPAKNVLYEEFTTAVCQYCPDGSSRLDDIVTQNTGFIPAALHDGFGTDAMTTADHTTLANEYTDFAPAVMVDRKYYKDEDGTAVGLYNDPYDRWLPYGQARKTEKTPVSISATNVYNNTTRELTVDVNATFYSAITDDYRVNCYIVEDSVSGSGNGYNQINAYNTDANSPWYQKGNPIVGYQHRHVTRYMFGGPWGTTGVVPNTTADGTAYNKQYTYTLPAAWNADRVTLICLVQHYAADKFDRQILNAMEMKLNGTGNTGGATPTGIAELNVASVNSVTVYPNPATDLLTVEYTLNKSTTFNIEVRNILGQVVSQYPVVNLNGGSYKTQVNTSDFANGIYFVTLNDNSKTVKTLKFIVSK